MLLINVLNITVFLSSMQKDTLDKKLDENVYELWNPSALIQTYMSAFTFWKYDNNQYYADKMETIIQVLSRKDFQFQSEFMILMCARRDACAAEELYDEAADVRDAINYTASQLDFSEK